MMSAFTVIDKQKVGIRISVINIFYLFTSFKRQIGTHNKPAAFKYKRKHQKAPNG